MTDPAAPGRDLQREMSVLAAKNERLSDALVAAREQIIDLKRQVDDLAKPPGTYATFLGSRDDGSVDIISAGRKMHVGASPSLDVTRLRPGQEVMLNEALTVVEAGGYEEVGELVTDQGAARRRPRARRRPWRRGAGGALRRPGPGRARARRRRADDRLAQRVRVRGHPARRGRGPGARRGAGHRLQGHRRPRPADRGDPRRRRAALPAPRAVPRARAQAAQGCAPVRPARMRQDAHRQGRRALARGHGSGRARRGHRRHQELLPERQGPGAAQQVRRRDRAAHPPDLRPGPREGVAGAPGRRLLRRDGVAVPHPWDRRLQRRRDDDRAAAAQRDRRRRAARERHRHRRLEP